MLWKWNNHAHICNEIQDEHENFLFYYFWCLKYLGSTVDQMANGSALESGLEVVGFTPIQSRVFLYKEDSLFGYGCLYVYV